MRNILLVIKNNLYRLSRETMILIMIFVVMPVIVYLGVYFNEMDGIKGKIAVVGATIQQEEVITKSMGENDNITLKFMDESPTNTDLIKGIYLAEINLEETQPKVISFGKEEIKKSLEAGLKGETYEAPADTATVEGKIIGFLTMFLFFGSMMIMDFFLTDRENKVYSRVLLGTLSYYEYIIGQLIYSVIALTTPTIIISMVVIKVLAVELSISLGLFAMLILLMGVLATSFAILVSTLLKDKVAASMGGSAITMITCLLGGCLVNIVDTNKIMSFIRGFIPQKRLIDLANNFNNEDLAVLLVMIIAFILISIIVGKRQYENGDFV
ncbi:MAG: ABC transporter permease [Clostridium sp.]